jgi:hypothetical protein
MPRYHFGLVDRTTIGNPSNPSAGAIEPPPTGLVQERPLPQLLRAKAHMETILEETCRPLPNGGDHEVRAFIAHRLTDAVLAGLTTLGELGIVARKALADYNVGRSGEQ